MKIIDVILSSVAKIDDILKVVKAVLHGFEAFTDSLKEQNTLDSKI